MVYMLFCSEFDPPPQTQIFQAISDLTDDNVFTPKIKIYLKLCYRAATFKMNLKGHTQYTNLIALNIQTQIILCLQLGVGWLSKGVHAGNLGS